MKNNYRATVYGQYGQYIFQVIRVPLYWNLTLSGNITAPAWNLNSGGSYSGGVVVLYSVDTINLNGQTVSVAGMGFRGGGGRKLNGVGSTTTYAYTDYVTRASVATNASKGEGDFRYANVC